MVINQLKDYLNKNKSIKGFYTSWIHKKYKISPEESIKACEDLVDECLLERQFEVLCPECGRITFIADTIGEACRIDNCRFCGMVEEGFAREDIQIYYKVNR